MCRHCLWYLAPAAECVSLFGRSSLRRDGCSVLYFIALVLFAVNDVAQFVSVDGKRACYCYVMCGHYGRYLAPAGEGITFLRQFFLRCNCCSITHIIGLIKLAIHNVSQLICVDGERTNNGNIMRRHCCWNLAPTRESMAFFRRCRFRSYLCTIFHRVRPVYLSVNLVYQGKEVCYLYVSLSIIRFCYYSVNVGKANIAYQYGIASKR